MKPTPNLDTERLCLRAPVLEDGEARDFLRGCTANWGGDGPYTWLITRRDDGRRLGVIDIRPQGHRVERVLEKVGMAREGRRRGWSIHPNVSPLPRNAWCCARVETA